MSDNENMHDHNVVKMDSHSDFQPSGRYTDTPRQTYQLKPLALKAGDDLTDEAPLHTICEGDAWNIGNIVTTCLMSTWLDHDVADLCHGANSSDRRPALALLGDLGWHGLAHKAARKVDAGRHQSREHNRIGLHAVCTGLGYYTGRCRRQARHYATQLIDPMKINAKYEIAGRLQMIDTRNVVQY